MTEPPDPQRLNGLIQELLLSRTLNPNATYLHSVGVSPYCATCQHHLMSDDVARGLQLNGHMSAVRRFFCLFVTFDFLLTSLLWLICLVLAGNFDFTSAFYKEIVHYSIKTSLFDVVMSSMSRLVILELFYGLIQSDQWFFVATTTVGTCCFSVVKVYIFDWSQSQQVLAVMLIISSFILSWSEVWLLDIKVIPQERLAVTYLTGVASPDERSPLIRPYPHLHPQFDLMSDSVGVTFYSPVESPQGSDDEDDKGKDPAQTGGLEAGGKALLLEAWEVLNNDNWKLEKTTPDGDKIFSQQIGNGKKVFRLLGVVDAPLNLLMDVLYHHLEDFPSWNPTIKESKILRRVGDHSDIIYQMSAAVGKGLVSSRDFVMLRHLSKKDGFQVIVTASIPDSSQPIRKNIIRGENGPGCWAFRELAAFETEVRWLLNTNIGGWVPHSAVESALVSVMSENMRNLRKRLVALSETATT